MVQKIFRSLTLISISLVLHNYAAYARSGNTDTIKLTVKQAEELFIKNNLTLLAQHYNIDIANAQVLSARLFNNPEFSISNGIAGSGEPNPGAEQSANISQLITTAGKRNKNIKLAQIGVEQARYQFFDLLRTLKNTLRTNFFTVHYQRQSEQIYDKEIKSLSQTFDAYKEQYTKGNISQKELLRLQAQLYSLKVEFNNLIIGVDTTESQLKFLLKVPATTTLVPTVEEDILLKQDIESVKYETLIDSALANRYDLKYTKSTLDYNTLNLQLQKSNAIPDVTATLNFDKLGSYGHNFLSAGIGIPLPLFNRNQGAIKQAKLSIDQSTIQIQNQQAQVESDVTLSYKIASRQEQLNKSFEPQFTSDFNHLIEEVYKNYLKRNISLLEFLDYYDTYKTNTLLMNNMLLNRVNALEQINFATGTSFFNK